jgi:hypothetical protein
LVAVNAHADDYNGREYLLALAGGAPTSHFLEIRYRVGDHALATAFFPAHDAGAVLAWVNAHARDTDVYVGCAPRCRQSGTKRDIEQVWVLWAECDGAAAARAALAYRPQPAIVVRSGSGQNLHAYWPLREPASPRDAEVANLRLAHAIGADKACFDAARILRPPGSWNHKHAPPTPVVALWVDAAARFHRDDVLGRAPEIDVAPIEQRWEARPTRDPGGDRLLSIPPAVYVATLLGVEARPGRKVRCPFHDDERPSLHVYATASRGWSCFSCRRGGSIYDLAAELWEMGTRGRAFVDLRRELEARFATELSLDARGIDR